jgi:hypothetical protein
MRGFLDCGQRSMSSSSCVATGSLPSSGDSGQCDAHPPGASGTKIALDSGAFAYMPVEMIHKGWTKSGQSLYTLSIWMAWDYNPVDRTKNTE